MRLAGEDQPFHQVSTDTRTLQPGDLFVALIGPNFDGHEYIAQAEEKGAGAFLVSKPVSSIKPQIVVKDTLVGLGQLGKAWVSQFELAKVAITGSCGKTTVKEMLAAILSLQGSTLATKGNLNNEIGAPLTLLSVKAEHQYGVIELGANHQGEIAYTVAMVEPHVALVNNVAAAHLEGFGSIDNIAKAKFEIYGGLADGGTAVVNLDGDFSGEYLEKLAKKHTLS